MANTRGRTAIHGPSSTGTIKAGNITPPSAAPITVGSGANSGNTTTIRPGTVAPGRNAQPKPSGSSAVNAGHKTTVGEGSKQPLSGGPSAKGVGAATPYKRKKQRTLGKGGNIPA